MWLCNVIWTENNEQLIWFSVRWLIFFGLCLLNVLSEKHLNILILRTKHLLIHVCVSSVFGEFFNRYWYRDIYYNLEKYFGLWNVNIFIYKRWISLYIILSLTFVSAPWFISAYGLHLGFWTITTSGCDMLVLMFNHMKNVIWINVWLKFHAIDVATNILK